MCPVALCPNMKVNVHITRNWRKKLMVIYLILKKKNVGIELITFWDHLVAFGKSQIRAATKWKVKAGIKKSCREIEHQMDGKHLRAQLLMICFRPGHEILSKSPKDSCKYTWQRSFHWRAGYLRRKDKTRGNWARRGESQIGNKKRKWGSSQVKRNWG